MSEVPFSIMQHDGELTRPTVADTFALMDYHIEKGNMVRCLACDGLGDEETWPDGPICQIIDCPTCNGRGYTAAETKGEGE